MRQRFSPALTLLLELCLVPVVWSAEAPHAIRASVEREDLVVIAEGRVVDDTTLELQLTPGQIAALAIRVYSEPSHTLLALLLDQSFSSSPEGLAWLLELFRLEKPAVTWIAEGLTSRATLLTRARPSDDQRIVVWVNGRLPDGSDGDRIVADAKVGPAGFGFSMSWVTLFAVDGSGPLAPGHGHPCCSSAPCGEVCTDCEGLSFTCCVLGPPRCCWIVCGNSNDCFLCTCYWNGCWMN